MTIVPTGSTFNDYVRLADEARKETPGQTGIMELQGKHTIDLNPAIDAGGDQYGFRGCPQYGVKWYIPGGKKVTIEVKGYNRLSVDEEVFRLQPTEQAVYPGAGVYGDGELEIIGDMRIDWSKPREMWPAPGAAVFSDANQCSIGDEGQRIRAHQFAGAFINFRKDHGWSKGRVQLGMRWGGRWAHGYDGGPSKSGGDFEISNWIADGIGEGLFICVQDNALGGLTVRNVNAANCPYFAKKEGRWDPVANKWIEPYKKDFLSGCNVYDTHLENHGAFIIGDPSGYTFVQGLDVWSVLTNGVMGERGGAKWRLLPEERRGWINNVQVNNWTIHDDSFLAAGEVAVFHGCELLDADLGDLTDIINTCNRVDLNYRMGQTRELVRTDAVHTERSWGTYRGKEVSLLMLEREQMLKIGDPVEHPKLGHLGVALQATPVQAWPTKPVIPVLWEGDAGDALA